MSRRSPRMLDLTPQPGPSSPGVTHPALPLARRWQAATLLAAAAALLPWMVLLWVDDSSAGNSLWVTLPWEVLDAAEMLSLAAAGYLTWRHDLRAVIPLFTGAALLISDGVADVSLAPSEGLFWPVTMLACAELPLALLCIAAIVGMVRGPRAARVQTTRVPAELHEPRHARTTVAAVFAGRGRSAVRGSASNAPALATAGCGS